MIKYFFIILFLISSLFATTIKNRLEKAEVGDYMVTISGKTYFLLLVEKKNQESIIISEIAIEKEKIKKNFSWREWIKNNSPYNLSWHVYEIDLNNEKLKRCLSVNENKFTNNETLTLKLLSIPLSIVPTEKRKKIGPPPLNEEKDIRSIWNPPMYIDKKKVKNANFEVYQAKWPKDNSSLSGKVINIYFDKEKKFSFPFWIEIETNHLDIILKTVDSGKNIKIPQRLFLKKFS
ncbi:MAG: hypothetical protein AMS24_04095 [Chlamydiae bacterium SM23_39]|nr:MAG: hypothetical protein AMS24_04095 [Chlamydiae bacterium SM23_39]